MQFRDSDGNLLEPELVSPPLKRLHPMLHHDGAKGDSKVDVCDGSSSRLRNSSGDQENNSKDNQPVSVKERMCASQPAFRGGSGGSSSHSGKPPGHTPANQPVNSGRDQSFNFGGFTQPAQLSDLFCGSQDGGTQGQTNSQSQFQRLVKRMTRFWVSTDMSETQK